MQPSPIQTEERVFGRDGDEIRGIAAWCGEEAEPRAAVILLPDVYGVSDLYERIGQRFAVAGFFSFLLDPYSREGRPTLPDLPAVFAWIDQLDDRRLLADVAAAVSFVQCQPELRQARVGIAGFCLGGQYALQAACSVAGLDAAVSFYGMLRYAAHSERKPASPIELAPALACPYLGLFGADDALIPAADVDALATVLRDHEKTFAIHVYPGAGHAFCNDTRPDAYRPAAAADAFARAEGFLRRYLMGK